MIEVTDEMKALVDDELGDIDTGYYHWGEYRDSTIKRIIELHEANKPKPEPFGYFRLDFDTLNFIDCDEDHNGAIALYEAPPTREPLSAEAIVKLGDGYCGSISFARAIEQAHGIGITK